jgi:hypothetical protein
MANRPHAGDPEINFHMTIAIPGQRPNPVAQFDAQPFQRLSQFLGPQVYIAIIGPVNGPLNSARNNFDIPMILTGIFD